MSIPKSMEAIYRQLEPILTAFCEEYLNEDYRRLCLLMLEKLCRKRPSPLLSGRLNTWAAGIVYFICSENNYFQRGIPRRLSAKELAACFDLSASTASGCAAKIRSLCGLKSLSERRWYSYFEDDPENPWLLGNQAQNV